MRYIAEVLDEKSEINYYLTDKSETKLLKKLIKELNKDLTSANKKLNKISSFFLLLR